MLRQKNIPAFYYSLGNDASSSYASASTPTFKKKMRWKLIIIHKVLLLGYSVLYADSDVLLLKNPFPYLSGISGYDFIAQSDVGCVCSGFMFIRPSNQSLYLLKQAVSYIQNPSVRDQVAINEALKATKTPAFRLPSSLFAGGLEFFGKYQYYWDRKGIFDCADLDLDDDFIILHNHYIKDRFGKELRLKEMKMYALDTDKEYSGIRQYLTVEVMDPSRLSNIK